MRTPSLLAFAAAALLAAPALAGEKLAHVETRGTGEHTLVLIPGLVCDWTVWESFMDRNAEAYTMHAVTIPGMAGAEPFKTPESIEGTPWLDASLEAVANMIREKNLENPVVIGHSLGGTLAMRLAAEHPDLIAGAVSVDGMTAFPLGPSPVSKEQRAQMVNTMMGPQMLNAPDEQWFGQFEMMGPVQMTDQTLYATWKEHFKKTPPKIGARYMVELMKTDITDDLADIEDPLLVMPADNEPQQAFLGGEAAVEQLWAAQTEHAPANLLTVTWAPDSRHFIFFDKPEWFDEQIAAFVAGEEPSEAKSPEQD